MISLISMGMRSNLINWELLRKIDVLGIITLSLGLGTATFILEEGARDPCVKQVH